MSYAIKLNQTDVLITKLSTSSLARVNYECNTDINAKTSHIYTQT
jgi:hypothetical protein